MGLLIKLADYRPPEEFRLQDVSIKNAAGKAANLQVMVSRKFTSQLYVL